MAQRRVHPFGDAFCRTWASRGNAIRDVGPLASTPGIRYLEGADPAPGGVEMPGEHGVRVGGLA